MKKALKHPKAKEEDRQNFCQRIKVYQEQNKPIAYIDERGFRHNMLRTHGYAPKGQKCYKTHDWGARGRLTP
ncbi:MAG: hypothetical protein ACRYE9_06190 [Janthinobacterium lividum]